MKYYVIGWPTHFTYKKREKFGSAIGRKGKNAMTAGQTWSG